MAQAKIYHGSNPSRRSPFIGSGGSSGASSKGDFGNINKSDGMGDFLEGSWTQRDNWSIDNKNANATEWTSFNTRNRITLFDASRHYREWDPRRDTFESVDGLNFLQKIYIPDFANSTLIEEFQQALIQYQNNDLGDGGYLWTHKTSGKNLLYVAFENGRVRIQFDDLSIDDIENGVNRGGVTKEYVAYKIPSIIPTVVNGKVDLAQIQMMTATGQPSTGDYKGCWGLSSISFEATKLQYCIDAFNGVRNYHYAIWESTGASNSQNATLIAKGEFTATQNGIVTIPIDIDVIKGKYYTAILSLGGGVGGVSNFVGLSPKTNNGLAYGYNSPNTSSLNVGDTAILNGDASAFRYWFSIES